MVTDYDCWHTGHDDVTVEQIIAVVMQNADNASKVLKQAVALLPKERSCKCGSALAHAIMTDPTKIPAITREKLSLLLDKYLEKKKAGA
jgi:5'-methylthioadenosine phosphorylase